MNIQNGRPSKRPYGTERPIGGDEEVRLYLATIQIAGRPPTFFVALDAGDHAGLARLAQAAGPVIQSMRLPSGATGG